MAGFWRVSGGLAVAAGVGLWACDSRVLARPDSGTVVASETIPVGASKLQIDFAEGTFDLPRSAIVDRIAMAAHAVEVYYGRFPVARARLLVVPVSGRHGVLQGTTWGSMGGFPAFLRIRIGTATTREELKGDWIVTHEMVHTALDSLPDDQHWLEEGLASYVEPVARAQAGEVTVESVWASFMDGMPNGEPKPGDQGLNATHTWGRTYWGGALFCLMADVQIRKETNNRRGLQDALRAIVAGGGTIDKEWPLQRVLQMGDNATGTHVLATMYGQWGSRAVLVDLPELWKQLGVKAVDGGAMLDAGEPLAAIRMAITKSETAPVIRPK